MFDRRTDSKSDKPREGFVSHCVNELFLCERVVHLRIVGTHKRIVVASLLRGNNKKTVKVHV